MRQKDGAPLRDHLKALARGGDPEAKLRLNSPPKLTQHVKHLWNAFADLSSTRQVNGMALAPISRLEIRIWEADELTRLDHWERRAILRLDAEFRAAHAPAESGATSKTDKSALAEES